MKIYAIGDLHLPGGLDKSMERFGWIDHKEKIFSDWAQKVSEEDLVLLAGDISWAMTLDQAKGDLDEISAMKGQKVMIRGNHDFWWSGIGKMQKQFPKIRFLQNNCHIYGEYAICGSRGWICPNDVYFKDQDIKIYHREAHRLRLSLEEARKKKAEKIIAMIHYPPTNDKKEKSLFTDLFEEYNVEKVIYGHLHGENSFSAGVKGHWDGREYFLVSCDYLDFQIKQIL